MKIAYLGIDLMHPVLQAILREGGQVMKIFTCPTDNKTEFNTAVRETARLHRIPCTLERITSADLAELEAAGCELLVCAGYYYRTPVSDALPMVNFHPSPLPLGRGAWPMPLILLRGLPCGGLTLHKMTAEFDMGDILLRESFPIREEETLQSYMEQVCGMAPDMVRRLMADSKRLLSGAFPQGDGEYWPMPTKELWTVTPDMGVEQADRILRAFLGYECIYRADGKCTELIGGRGIPGNSDGQAFPVRGGYILAERIREI